MHAPVFHFIMRLLLDALVHGVDPVGVLLPHLGPVSYTHLDVYKRQR